MTDVTLHSTDIAPGPCPACGHLLEAATGTGKKTPGPDTVTLCIYCRTLLKFTADMQHRLLTNAEWLALPHDERVYITKLREDMATWPTTRHG